MTIHLVKGAMRMSLCERHRAEYFRFLKTPRRTQGVAGLGVFKSGNGDVTFLALPKRMFCDTMMGSAETDEKDLNESKRRN